MEDRAARRGKRSVPQICDARQRNLYGADKALL